MDISGGNEPSMQVKISSHMNSGMIYWHKSLWAGCTTFGCGTRMTLSNQEHAQVRNAKDGAVTAAVSQSGNHRH